jgi:hypothetical protein
VVPGAEQSPTVADIDRIARHADPLIRNLQITQCYRDLSSALAELTGTIANWCTYATWASKQAGQTIRREDLVRTFEQLFNQSRRAPEAAYAVVASVSQMSTRGGPEGIWEATWEALHPLAAFDRASDAVARGNKKVFEEIGREFARYLALGPTGTLDAQAVARFCEGLRPGDPPDGQRYLAQAFTAYHKALLEDDAKPKAEWMLLGNLAIGFHEQTRLQPEITEALDAPFIHPLPLTQRLLRTLFPHRPSVLVRVLWARIHGRTTPLDTAWGELVTHVRALAHRAITESLMTLALPGEVLRLGRHLAAPFPQRLERIENPDLQALLQRVDPTPDTPVASGAENWADLPERMHFIADLFRTYQERPVLFSPPFTVEQVKVIREGGRPAGRL